MTKVRFYCRVPKHGVSVEHWTLAAWTDLKTMGGPLSHEELVAFDVDMPDRLVRGVDLVVPSTPATVVSELK